MCSRLFILIVAIATLVGCTQPAKFKTGDYLMPKGSTSVSDIVKVVGVEDKSYKVFFHFLSNGHLIAAQDYQRLLRSKLEGDYVLVEPPQADGTFSPNKYLSRP